MNATIVKIHTMGKNPYSAPQVEVFKNNGQPMLYQASPGVGGGYNPGEGFEAKEPALDQLPTEFNDPWED